VKLLPERLGEKSSNALRIERDRNADGEFLKR
jgi:hypothetical protein